MAFRNDPALWGACMAGGGVCPADAVAVEGTQIRIVDETCTRCGLCLPACPHDAIKASGDVARASELALSGRAALILSVECAVFFYPATPEQVVNACYATGFRTVHRGVLGDELVAKEYLKLWADEGWGSMIRSTCPVIVETVRTQYPELIPYLAPIATPIAAEARYLKGLHGADTPLVYAGVCLTEGGRDVDAAITFEELADLFRRRGVKVESQAPYFTRVPEERRRHLSTAGGRPPGAAVGGKAARPRVPEGGGGGGVGGGRPAGGGGRRGAGGGGEPAGGGGARGGGGGGRPGPKRGPAVSRQGGPAGATAGRRGRAYGAGHVSGVARPPCQRGGPQRPHARFVRGAVRGSGQFQAGERPVRPRGGERRVEDYRARMLGAHPDDRPRGALRRRRVRDGAGAHRGGGGAGGGRQGAHRRGSDGAGSGLSRGPRDGEHRGGRAGAGAGARARGRAGGGRPRAGPGQGHGTQPGCHGGWGTGPPPIRPRRPGAPESAGPRRSRPR